MVGPWVLSGSGGTWTGPGSGSWATAGSWSGNFVPGVEGDTALFGGSIAAAATVTLDSDRTLSGLTFDNSSYSYTIAGVNSLTLANSGLPVPVTVANGSHTIAVPVVLADDADIAPAFGTTLTISGPISETGGMRTVILSDQGTLVLANGNNTFTGGVQIRAGTLQLNDFNAVQYGTVSVGVDNGLTFGSGGTYNLGGLAGVGSFAMSATDASDVSLVVGADNENTVYAGNISGGPTSSLTKVGSGVLTITGSVSGAGAVTVGGSGTLVITGTNNTYSGGTVVNSGTLFVTAGASDGNSANISNVGTGMVTVNPGGTLIGEDRALGFGYNTIAAPLTINGGVVTADANAGSPYPNPPGALFCGALTMTGGTINGDTFALNGTMTVHAGAGPSIVSPGEFWLDNTGGRASTFIIDPGAEVDFNCNITDWGYTGWMEKYGAGTIVFNGASTSWALGRISGPARWCTIAMAAANGRPTFTAAGHWWSMEHTRRRRGRAGIISPFTPAGPSRAAAWWRSPMAASSIRSARSPRPAR